VKVAAAYIRVSTDDQIEFSPDSQLEKIKLYAERIKFYYPKSLSLWTRVSVGEILKKELHLMQ